VSDLARKGPPAAEKPFPETVVHAHLDGTVRKYIPVDGAELKEMLAAERRKVLEDLTKHFEVALRCHECGEPMFAPVSLWRCSGHPSDHQGVGPAVALEMRDHFDEAEKEASKGQVTGSGPAKRDD
jgi:hypothetical protein